MADKAAGHSSQPHHPQNNVLVYSVSPECNAVPALQAPVNSVVPKPSPPVYYRTAKFDPGGGASVESLRPILVESVCSNLSVHNDSNQAVKAELNENCEYKPESVAPPCGWKRILSNGIIIYISPSNTALNSEDQVKCYIQTEGTCKCGLECPLHLPSAFNFDPKVLTKPYSSTVIAPGDLTKLCNHKRKLLSNVESLPVDSRLGAAASLKRKKKRLVVGGGGGGGQVIIGGNQAVSPAGTMLPQGMLPNQQNVMGMYQAIPHATNMQQVSSLQHSGTLQHSSPLQQNLTINQAASLSQDTTLHQHQQGPALGFQPGSSIVGIQPAQTNPAVGIQQGNPAMLGLQQGVSMQSAGSPSAMQQNIMLGMQQGTSMQQSSSTQFSLQQNPASLGMQPSPALQPNAVLHHTSSQDTSPALSNGSLAPPSSRMTPPILPSPSRVDIHNTQFAKMQQQVPSSEVWRETNFQNNFMEYIPPNGGVEPSISQDGSLLQHQMHGSPAPDIMPSSGSVVTSEEGVSFINQNQMLCRNLVQSESPLPQPPNLIQNTLLPPGPQVLPPGSQVLHNPVREMSAAQSSTLSVPQQPNPQSTMVRRYPASIASQSPQTQQPTYQINQPVQVHYDNTRVCPSGYSIKYAKKSNNQVQQQIVDDQITLSNSQVPTSYQGNMQSSSQHFSQQVVTNHHLIVSTQQNTSSQQHVVNTSHQNIDQTSFALQQNVNSQQSIQSVTTSKQSANSQVHNVSSQEVGSSSIGRVRTPPWHQNKQQHLHQPIERTTWTRKNKPKDEGSPSFLEDPSGYLAQQTAMLRQVVAGREEEEGPKTMASSHTASSNTLTSVLAGRSNTLTVSVGSQEPKPQQHILVSGNGQFIIATTPKVNPPSPLLLPAPLLLQPLDTVQLPQLVVPSTIHEDVMEKRKSPNKKRKSSPPTSATTTMLLSPQPQQQLLTILPSKTPIANMIQPLNVVQNFPIQQFLVPSMVMSDGTILQDTVQVNLLPGTGMFSGGQNLLTPTSVVLRAPATSQPQQPQPPKFIHSPNQFVNFSGDLSNQVVPATTNTTLVQQNTTTIVQQTTMVQQPSPSYILDKPNFILTSDKNNFVLNQNGNNGDKARSAGFVRNSVSTQTQNQVVQVSSTGPASGMMVTTGGSRDGSPPDTTTLSPADQEVSTSDTSPDPSMVQCVSSSNLNDDSSPYHIDTTTSNIPYQSGNGGKILSYDDSSYVHQALQNKDITQLSSADCPGKMLCTTTSDGSPLGTIEESGGLVK